MAKTFYGGSAVLTGAFLLTALAFNASPSAAEHLAADSTQQTQTRQTANSTGTSLSAETSAPTAPVSADAGGAVTSSVKNGGAALGPVTKFTATAYALGGRTASGAAVRRGLIAADRRVLPLGTRVRLEAGGYSGEYLVADTGGAVRGRLIDIWVPSTREAMRFGRRPVKLTILSYGARRAASAARKGRRS